MRKRKPWLNLIQFIREFCRLLTLTISIWWKKLRKDQQDILNQQQYYQPPIIIRDTNNVQYCHHHQSPMIDLILDPTSLKTPKISHREDKPKQSTSMIDTQKWHAIRIFHNCHHHQLPTIDLILDPASLKTPNISHREDKPKQSTSTIDTKIRTEATETKFRTTEMTWDKYPRKCNLTIKRHPLITTMQLLMLTDGKNRDLTQMRYIILKMPLKDTTNSSIKMMKCFLPRTCSNRMHWLKIFITCSSSSSSIMSPWMMVIDQQVMVDSIRWEMEDMEMEMTEETEELFCNSYRLVVDWFKSIIMILRILNRLILNFRKLILHKLRL